MHTLDGVLQNTPVIALLLKYLIMRVVKPAIKMSVEGQALHAETSWTNVTPALPPLNKKVEAAFQLPSALRPVQISERI